MSEGTDAADAASTLQLYNLLLAGSKIRMQFGSIQAATALRNSLAVLKHRQDRVALAVGLFETTDTMTFKFDVKSRKPPIEVVLSFVEKKLFKQFTFQIMEDAGVETSNEAEETEMVEEKDNNE